MTSKPTKKPTSKKAAASEPRHKFKALPKAALSVAVSFPDMIAARPKLTNASSARERILFAAVEILNADGFGAMTQTRVAERAGLRQSHLTYYFPTRNDLLRETAVFGCDTMLEVMSGGIDAGVLTIDNFREFIAPDIHDRRFARLMCALIVASDEDESIKLWLKNFEDANHTRYFQCFKKLGLNITKNDLECFHSTMVGSLMIDLGESSNESLARARGVVQHAFDALVASATSFQASEEAASAKSKKASAKPATAKKISNRK